MSLDVAENDSSYIILTSSAGHSFTVSRAVVVSSGFLRNILNSPAKWKETTDKIPKIVLQNIDTATLEKVIQYFYYKHRWDGHAKRPKFDIELHEVIKLLLAANFLDV